MIEFTNGTVFNFVDATPQEAPSTVRQFLNADLIDFMHLTVVPITLGRGVSLWDGTSGVDDRFTIETTTSPSGVTHHLWNRKSRA